MMILITSYVQFYYLIDLHYSQTADYAYYKDSLFYYLIDLHYSQTTPAEWWYRLWFYYLIDIHYSQTCSTARGIVLSFTTL